MNDLWLRAHWVLGILVALAAVLAIWNRSGRRVLLYALTLQIVLGIALMVAGLRPPGAHPALAVVGWAGYMGANAVGKRRGEPAARAIAAVSTLLVLVTFWLGQHALAHR